MRSFINATSTVEFVIDRQDRTNVADMLQLRGAILPSLRLYGRRTLAGSAHRSGKHLPGKSMHRCAVTAVGEPTMTAPGSPTCWRP